MNQRPAWRKASEWMLAGFTKPTTLGKQRALIVIVTIMLAIGLADYATGIRISLAIFYFVPVLLAVAWFGWETAVAIVLSSVAVRIIGDFIAYGQQPLPFWSWWNSFSTILVFLFIVWIFNNLLTLHRQLEKRVAERTAELLSAVEHRRQLEHELLVIGSRERNTMGQELHDDICQHLVGTAFAAKVLTQRLTQEGNLHVNEAQTIIDLIEEGASKTRHLARGLLLSAIEPNQLPEKLIELAEEGSRSGVPCSFRQDGDVVVPDAGIAAQLYRIAQEAMRNAIKHAESKHVDISLVGDQNAICLVVEDDGRGISESEQSSGMGLRIMSHRATYIGATLSLIPTVGQGTKVFCHLPIEESAA